MPTMKRLLNDRYSDVQHGDGCQRATVAAVGHGVAGPLPGIARAHNLSKYGLGHVVIVFAKEY